MKDLFNQTMVQAARGLQNKDFSSEELTRSCLDRIKQTDENLHAFITVTEREALDAARLVDNKRSNNEDLSFLAGIPASVKDVIATRGIKTTACSKILENYTPPYDATVVKKLRDRGMIILGKVNCDEFAHGASTENSAFGPSRNPWDITRVPGGSSGGSAVSVAAQQTFYSLGTDTGGSIRQPAAFCGVSSIKPSYGRVSRYGLLSMASSSDCLSPMAKTVEDLAHILLVMAGTDEFDGTTFSNPVEDYPKELERVQIKGMKVGVPKEYFGRGLTSGVRHYVELFIRDLENAGAQIEEISLPHMSYAVAVYYIITPSEISSNLARYDGIRFGFSAAQNGKVEDEVQNLFEVYSKTRRYGFGDEAKRRIMLGTYALSAGYYDAYYKKASQVRTLIKRDFDKAFEKVDLIVTPTTPDVAFKLGEKSSDPLQMYLEDVYVAPASLAGLPAMNIPCGFASAVGDGTIEMPVGAQIIAPQLRESRLLGVGYQYQKSTDWHIRMQGLDL